MIDEVKDKNTIDGEIISETTENSITTFKPANKPEILSDKEDAEIKRQATSAVKDLVIAKGSTAMEVSTKLTNVGIKDQKLISSNIALMQEKVGKIFYSIEKNSTTTEINKDMTDLQEIIAKINPKDVQNEAYFRFVRIIPFFGDRLVSVLKTIAQRRQSLQQFIDHLESSLKEGQSMLITDNAQLMVVYKDIEGKEKLIIADAYLAEVMRDALQLEIPKVTDPERRHDLQRALLRISARGQDLWAMDNINNQFFVSLKTIIESNEDLCAAVDRMLTIGMQVLYVSFAIQAALARAKDVTELYNKTRTLIGDTLVNNARSINQYVTQIGDIYKDPTVAVKSLETACNLLVEAMVNMNKLQAANIVKTRENSDKIKVITENMKKEKGNILVGEIASIEASNMPLELNAGK